MINFLRLITMIENLVVSSFYSDKDGSFERYVTKDNKTVLIVNDDFKITIERM